MGGMAEVWRATATFEDGTEHPVAIKRVRPTMGDAIYHAMFEDEARIGMMLRHPNIVRVFDAREVRDVYFLVMELVDGEPLRGLLRVAHERGAKMPLQAALFITRELVAALEYAHGATDANGRPLSLVHRDVSPHNLLLSRAGEVKLVDFSLADTTVNTAVRGDLVGGKLAYLAPELALQKAHDHRVDLFAAGVLLWEMLAGRRLFHGADAGETVRAVMRCEVPWLREVNSSVPESVDMLVQQLVTRSPSSRVESATVLRERVEKIIADIGNAAGPRDVGLLVNLHLARHDARRDVKTLERHVVEHLAEELAALANGAAAKVDQTGARRRGRLAAR